jgi:transposase-like protein
MRRLHGVSGGQLYTWRKQFRRGELTGFVPARLHLNQGHCHLIYRPSPPPPNLRLECRRSGASVVREAAGNRGLAKPDKQITTLHNFPARTTPLPV